jgi:hypothetical protein
VFRLGNSVDRVLYDFTGGNDGANPVAALVFDSAKKNANLWGTAQSGGIQPWPNGFGTIFELTASSGYSELIVEHSFLGEGEMDGASPQAALTLDSTANLLYGTTAQGGNSASCILELGCGTVFQFPLPSSSESYSSFYSFTGSGPTGSGAVPTARLALETSPSKAEFGYVYGTASQGGIDCGTEGCGTAFAVCPPVVCPSGVQEYTLFAFDFTDGANPAAGMLLNLPKLKDAKNRKGKFPPPTGKGDCTSNCGGTGSGGGSDPSGVVFILTN